MTQIPTCRCSNVPVVILSTAVYFSYSSIESCLNSAQLKYFKRKYDFTLTSPRFCQCQKRTLVIPFLTYSSTKL